jgi:hypothetical protein
MDHEPFDLIGFRCQLFQRLEFAGLVGFFHAFLPFYLSAREKTLPKKRFFEPFFWPCINTGMTNQQFLQSIYDTVQSLGLVKSQYEFGHLCGRQNSWFSSAKSVGRSMSIGSMISLVTKLERIPSTDIPRAMRPHVKSFIAMLWQMIENKAAGPAHN